MSDSLHERASEVFLHAISLTDGDQLEYLDSVCGDDPDLRREVESLLSFHDAPAPELQDDGKGIESMLREAVESAPDTPETVGPYRIVETLGEGGMGVVYRAEQANPARDVALKVVRLGGASPALQRRFEQEAWILGRLRHPGIAVLYEAGVATGPFGPLPYFAMELVDGVPLLEYATTARLDTGARVELVSRICSAVQHAHQKGVVHRDLKPANILVTSDGDPKVLDFGVAKILEDQERGTETRTGQLVGTLRYMSPEQLAGDAGDVDTRSDVYAIGVILYELLAGEPPYRVEGLSMYDAITMIRDVVPAPPSKWRREVRGDLDVIVGKSLAKRPEDRYQGVSELKADLDRYRARRPITARRPSPWYIAWRFITRHPWLTAAVLIVGTTTTVLTTTTLRNRQRASNLLAVLAHDPSALDPFAPPNWSKEQLDHVASVAWSLGSARETVRIHTVLGRAYADLGDAPAVTGEARSDAMTRARRHIDRALEQARDEGSVEYAEILHEDGRLCFNEGRIEDALTQYRGALAIRKRELGETDRDYLETLNHIGVCHWRLGDVKRGIELLEEVLEARETRAEAGDDADMSWVMASRNNLAPLLRDRGSLVRAEELVSEVAEWGRANGLRRDYMVRTLRSQARSLAMVGDLDGSITCIDAARNELSASAHDDHRQCDRLEAQIRTDYGDWTGAETAGRSGRLGERDLSRVLAALELGRGDPSAALHHLRAGGDLEGDTLTDSACRSDALVLTLAEIRIEQGESNEAADLVAIVHERLDDEGVLPQHPKRVRIARLSARLQSTEQAIETLTTCLAAFDGGHAFHPEAARAGCDLAVRYAQTDDMNRADSTLDTLRVAVRSTVGTTFVDQYLATTEFVRLRGSR